YFYIFCFLLTVPAPTVIYTLSLHDALPILLLSSRKVPVEFLYLNRKRDLYLLFLFSAPGQVMTKKPASRIECFSCLNDYMVFNNAWFRSSIISWAFSSPTLILINPSEIPY